MKRLFGVFTVLMMALPMVAHSEQELGDYFYSPAREGSSIAVVCKYSVNEEQLPVVVIAGFQVASNIAVNTDTLVVGISATNGKMMLFSVENMYYQALLAQRINASDFMKKVNVHVK